MLKKICIFLFLCASAIYAQEQPKPETHVGEPTVDVVLKVFKWGYSNAMIIHAALWCWALFSGQ